MECIKSVFECQTIIVGLLYGLLSGLLLLIILFFLRIRVKVASKILLDTKNQKARIKIVNNSYLWKLINVKAELSIIKPHETIPEETSVENITLTRSEILIINNRCLFCNEKYSSTYLLSVTKDGFNKLEAMNDNKKFYIRLRISFTNSFTNFTKIVERKYYVNDIIEGNFKPGNCCDY